MWPFKSEIDYKQAAWVVAHELLGHRTSIHATYFKEFQKAGIQLKNTTDFNRTLLIIKAFQFAACAVVIPQCASGNEQTEFSYEIGKLMFSGDDPIGQDFLNKYIRRDGGPVNAMIDFETDVSESMLEQEELGFAARYVIAPYTQVVFFNAMEATARNLKNMDLSLRISKQLQNYVDGKDSG